MFKKLTKWLYVALALTQLITAGHVFGKNELPGVQTSAESLVSIVINGQAMEVEYASTFAQRSVGLMNRPALCQQCGMLFKFANPKIASMWMKNTLIPLDVAFMRSDGVITDIRALEPHDLTSIGSSEKVLYALEMNQGWFSQHKIAVGDKMHIKAQ